MKKWIVGTAAFLLLGLCLLSLACFSGEEHLLLDCLPQGEWLEFSGGCGNPTNPGRGLNLDEYRDRCNVPEDVLDTTAENVRSVLAHITVRGGRFLELKGDFFHYGFLSGDGAQYRLRIFENGNIVVEKMAEPSVSAFYHDGGNAYRTLDDHFASIHELREWMDVPAWD